MSSTAKTITGASGQTFKRPERVAQEGEATTSYVRLGQLKKGDIAVEGIYLGATQNITYPEKLDFNFEDANGNKIVVNEGGNLKARMKEHAAGTLLMIVYQGKQMITKGPRKGKEAHNVEVLVAD